MPDVRKKRILLGHIQTSWQMKLGTLRTNLTKEHEAGNNISLSAKFSLLL